MSIETKIDELIAALNTNTQALQAVVSMAPDSAAAPAAEKKPRKGKAAVAPVDPGGPPDPAGAPLITGVMASPPANGPMTSVSQVAPAAAQVSIAQIVALANQVNQKLGTLDGVRAEISKFVTAAGQPVTRITELQINDFAVFKAALEQMLQGEGVLS